MCDDYFDDFDDLNWEDITFLGGMSEAIAREKREKEKIERDNDTSDDDYWEIINSRW